MARLLLAVLVGHTATVDSIDAHLAAPMRPLLVSRTVDSYRFGGGCTGGWDPGYDPSLDPRNWRPCSSCGGSTRLGASRCRDCHTAIDAGRDLGTVLEWDVTQWAPHPGDIVPLPLLLDPGWRYPTGHTPDAWVDLAGIEWLGTTDAKLTGTDTGQTPSRLRHVFDALCAGRRNPGPAQSRAGFDPTRWAVAVVDAHH
ncbi:hypothetical protein [Micromonospora sp. WMMD1082]|uniref:hypothetical protein n=1 Tax=Micromonospora sp. WMMD1082 TaxID=3016104 RepID=UPI0024164ECA|nr:hypothetical protein [Micromonospora sp. WMMD1082]MDG4795042.1 hypothetical protein [Micromonospora sp. WMMD1082]